MGVLQLLLKVHELVRPGLGDTEHQISYPETEISVPRLRKISSAENSY
jgi:hypothetical protein